MMNNEYVLTDVISDEQLNEIYHDALLCDANNKFKALTKYRMFIAWNNYLKDNDYKSDFECAARDYLIVNNTSIKIPNYALSETAGLFGLTFDFKEMRLYANHNYPSDISRKFLNAAFMQDDNVVSHTTKANLETNSFIRDVTGFSTFKSEEQKLAVIGALKATDGYTTLISMSTGGGKSMVIQTVAYQRPGLTVIIVPTVSLMLDQVRNFQGKGKNEVLFYNSSSNNIDLIDESIASGTLRMLYISPEAIICNARLKAIIDKANDDHYLKNFVIDEAHMVMEWGALFREDFQCLDIVRKQLIEKNPYLRTYLLSATFSEEAVGLLRNAYSENCKWREIRCDKLRREPRFSFIKATVFEKDDKTVKLICSLPHPMIVYVQTPWDANRLKELLKTRVGLSNVRLFTGQTVANERNELIDEWTRDEFTIMIATCAFGVGVDKRDVRTVLNLYVPENANNFYQEAGRGGRDGLPCLSIILYTDEDIDRAYKYIQKVLTTEKLRGRWFSMLAEATAKGNGQYIIDTTVKPAYNKSDETFEIWPNDGDVSWNVFVILFLKRRGLLRIDSLSYNAKAKYIFDITLLEPKLKVNNDESTTILEKCRQEEFNRNDASFKKMRNLLRNAQKQCVAATFNEVYGKTEEYCAGCNSHEDIHDYQSNNVLGEELNEVLPEISSKIAKIMYGATCKLILTGSEFKEITDLLVNIGINILVGPAKQLYFTVDDVHALHTVMAMNYNEFIANSNHGRMFLSGSICMILPTNDIHLLFRILSVCEQLQRKFGIVVIYLAESDVFISQKNKMLSELIEGNCVQAYAFAEECKNV